MQNVSLSRIGLYWMIRPRCPASVINLLFSMASVTVSCLPLQHRQCCFLSALQPPWRVFSPQQSSLPPMRAERFVWRVLFLVVKLDAGRTNEISSDRALRGSSIYNTMSTPRPTDRRRAGGVCGSLSAISDQAGAESRHSQYKIADYRPEESPRRGCKQTYGLTTD